MLKIWNNKNFLELLRYYDKIDDHQRGFHRYLICNDLSSIYFIQQNIFHASDKFTASITLPRIN